MDALTESRLTVPEKRVLKKAQDDLDRLERDLRIRVLHRRGHSNVDVARAIGLTESTVRYILKKRL